MKQSRHEKAIAADFATLTASEKWFCSGLLLVSRQLHFKLAAELWRALTRKSFIEETLSAAKAADKVKELVARGFLIQRHDLVELHETLLLESFVYPLLQRQREEFLKLVDQFLGRVRYNSYFFYYSPNPLDFIYANAHNFYSGNVTWSERTFDRFNYPRSDSIKEGILCHFIAEDWFAELPEKTQIISFNDYYNSLLFSFDRQTLLNPAAFDYFLDEKWRASPFFQFTAAPYLAEYLILRGEFTRAARYIEESTSPERHGLAALLTYIQSGTATAAQLFTTAFKAYKRETGRRNVAFQTLADVFYLVALLQQGSVAGIAEAREALDRYDKIICRFRAFYHPIFRLLEMKMTGKAGVDNILNLLISSNSWINVWWHSLVFFWLENRLDKTIVARLQESIKAAFANGFVWVALEGAALLESAGFPLEDSDKAFLDNRRNLIKMPLAERTRARENWEALLDAVELAITVDKKNDSNGDSRLIWVFEDNGHQNRIRPYEQKKLKSGRWSKGKEVFNYGYFFSKKAMPPFYTDLDCRIINMITAVEPRLRSEIEITGKILQMLVGQKNVYRNDFTTPLSIVTCEPELVLSSKGNDLIITWNPAAPDGQFAIVDGPGDCLHLYEFSEAHLKLAGLLKSGTRFPLTAANRLHELLSALSTRIKVRTDLFAGRAGNFASRPVDYRLHARLQPVNDGLRVALRLAPLPGVRADFVPGVGLQEAIVDVDGEKFHIRRDLEREIALVDSLIEQCPSLSDLDPTDRSAEFPDPADALQVLLELQQVKELALDWPENYKAKKVSTAKFADMKFRVAGDQDWFAIDGELQIDEEKVLNLQLLLRQYDGKNRFITIDDTRVLAITDDLRRRLSDINSYTDSAGGKRRFARAALPAFENLLADAGRLEVDAGWKNSLAKFHDIANMRFSLPPSFTAELREYQYEGFLWLSRLAALNMGACLADDMGLGKTVEALALILSRADRGPSLVIAPTSVCINWVNEARRFAPLLRPILFSQADRSSVMAGLSAFDLVICSYGIMSNEVERLSETVWQTLLLDEAQSIKNMNTGRSQAVMRLKAEFRMLLTGTPIENHLGELWNLFNFINPGLLGNIESFNRHFAAPIQNSGDKQAHGRLKRLVQPFILRRTKSQVLLDLPEKTEITLHVDLSPDETNLYESIRRESLEKIAGCDSAARPMQILAEIMRLRRMCCNPALVVPESGIASSKMELLERLVDELRDNRHKALIFSQFVDHLGLVRRLFDRKKIGYQYLDGSTPQKARAAAVEKFQGGSEDFFLISLKAGGLGLNLTAADYVIHLDPWWNPAVEDQASDRAYRIGQTRPVTIYRLIAAGTIEDKIVALHGRKRELADGLLAGSDLAARISAEELLQLISTV